jgi:putative transposase
MARLPRLALAGCAHYVRQTCVQGQALTLDAEDERQLLTALRELSAQYRVAIWAYALLAHELQLVLCPESDAGLGRFMQALGRRYVQAFNRRHARQGALWAGRYRATVVEDGEWLLASMLQVDILADEAGRPGSAAHHVGQRRDPWLAEPSAYWLLGNTPFERELEWRRRLDAGLGPAVATALARGLHGAWVIGSPAFTARVAETLGRPAAPRRAGRPRRSDPT